MLLDLDSFVCFSFYTFDRERDRKRESIKLGVIS